MKRHDTDSSACEVHAASLAGSACGTAKRFKVANTMPSVVEDLPMDNDSEKSTTEGGFVSLHEAFDCLAKAHAMLPAVEDGEDVGCWTYAQLRDVSLRLAAGLAEQFHTLKADGIDVTAADPVPPLALLMRRSKRWVAVHLAAMRLGVASLALSADLGSQDELHRNREAMLEHRPRILVVDRALRERAAGLLGGAEISAAGVHEAIKIIYVEELCGEGRRIPLLTSLGESPFLKSRNRCVDDPLYLVYTGGTTSASKCVVVTHRMALHELRTYPSIAPLKSCDRVLHQTSAYWGATSLGIFDLAWSCGACLVLTEAGAGPAEVALAIASLNISVAGIVPSVLEALEEDQCQSLRVVFTWGEALRPATATRWSERVSLLDLLIASEYWLILYADYQTPSTSGRPGFRSVRGAILTLLPPAREDESHADGIGEQLKIADVADGDVGELYLAGPMVSSVGYSNPSLNQGAFVELPIRRSGKTVRHFRTRDLAKRRADGSYEYCGRADGFAKVGGKWLDLAGVEERLRTGGCKDAALVWDEHSKERHAAVVFDMPTTRPQLALAARVARVQRLLPRDTHLHVFRDLPRHPTTNKVHRGAILRQIVEGAVPTDALLPPWLARVRRSLQCGLLLAACAGARGAEVIPYGLRLAPGLSSWHRTAGLLRGMPQGLAKHVLNWASWHRACGQILARRGSIAHLPHVGVLLSDAHLTGAPFLKSIAEGPLGLLGMALVLCRRAPSCLLLLLHHAGVHHAVRSRGGSAWVWAFWAGFPWLADQWCSGHWSATGQALTNSFRTFWSLLETAKNPKGLEKLLKLRPCHYCAEWSMLGDLWKDEWYCNTCTSEWHAYHEKRRKEGPNKANDAGSIVPSPTHSLCGEDETGQVHAKHIYKRWVPGLDELDFAASQVCEAEARTPKKEVRVVFQAAVSEDAAAADAAAAAAAATERISPIGALVEKCTGLNMTEASESLAGVESLKVIALVSALRRELGIELAATAVAGCGSLAELEQLCAEAKSGQEGVCGSSMNSGQSSDDIRLGESRNSWKIYAIPRFWNAPVAWLIRLNEVPNEVAMRAACRALVRRHIGLRIETKAVERDTDICQLVNNTAPLLVALRQLLGSDIGSGLLDRLSKALIDVWPPVHSIPPDAAAHARCVGAGAEEVQHLAGQEEAHFQWMHFDHESELRNESWLRARSRGFKPPASIAVLVLNKGAKGVAQDADRVATGEELPEKRAFLSIAVNHAVCDNATIVALYADLMALHKVALACCIQAGRPVAEIDTETLLAAAALPPVPNSLMVQQARLEGGLRCQGQDALDFAHGVFHTRRPGYDHYVRLLKGASRLLVAGAAVVGVPQDHLLIVALAVAYGRAANVKEAKVSLIIPNRDAVGEGHLIGNLANTRHLTIWVADRSLLAIALEMSQRLRRREWRLCDAGSDGDRVFVNLRGLPRFDEGSPEMDRIDTTRATTRFCGNVVEMFADQETSDQWTFTMGLRNDIDGATFASNLKHVLWNLAMDPLSLALCTGPPESEQDARSKR